MNDDTNPVGEETVRITIRLPKSLVTEIDEAAYVFGEISRNTAISRVLALDFLGNLATYARAAAHARAEAAREEAAQQLNRLGLRQIVKENF